MVEKENWVNWSWKDMFLRWEVRMMPRDKPMVKIKMKERRFASCSGGLKSFIIVFIGF